MKISPLIYWVNYVENCFRLLSSLHNSTCHKLTNGHVMRKSLGRVVKAIFYGLILPKKTVRTYPHEQKNTCAWHILVGDVPWSFPRCWRQVIYMSSLVTWKTHVLFQTIGVEWLVQTLSPSSCLAVFKLFQFNWATVKKTGRIHSMKYYWNTGCLIGIMIMVYYSAYLTV